MERVILAFGVFILLWAGAYPNLQLPYKDITVDQAWDMLSDITNGIQIPIDVRTYEEWYEERIDTPFPENPRHHPLSDFRNETKLQEFISLYHGKEIILYCLSGTRSVTAAKILEKNDFVGTVYNMLGGITEWKEAGFPTKIGNTPPNTPDKPSGPTIGIAKTVYTYSSSSLDPNDDPVKLGWDWDGDNNIDEWTEYNLSGITISASHSWDQGGTYNIKVIGEDSVGERSSFSPELEVLINTPPSKPTIKGPTEGKVGEEYEYSFLSTDPENHQIYYCIEWGDGSEVCIGPNASGEEIRVKHKWSSEGQYTIRAKARDTYDAESEWATLEITIPRFRLISLYYYCYYYFFLPKN